MPSISVFFPAYNDAPSLPALIGNTFAVLAEHASDYEAIVVNDGSFDNTGDVLRTLAEKFAPHLRIVTHPENRGYGGALRSGFAAASKELVFYTDGDGQYDVRELPKLLALMSPEVGLVNGYKLERNDPRHRTWIGNVYNALARFLFRIRLRDIDCDFRLIRRSLLDEMRLTSTSGTICVELVRKLELTGCRVIEVGVHHYPRLHGRSQFFRLQSLLVTLTQLARLWVRLVVLSSVARAEAVLACLSPQVDLKPLLKATASEWRANLRRLMDRAQFILGEELSEFEAEFAEAMHARTAVGVGSGTAAIELSLRDAGVVTPEKGEVLTTALTAPFTAVAIRAAGCEPRFADIDPETLQMSPTDAAARVTPRTRAIVPVHLYGQPCALDRFAELARRKKLALIQDACQAHGARFQGKPLAAFSTYVAYSFYPTKNLGALGDGGLILTNSGPAGRKLRSARDGGRRGGQISYTAGINSRLDDLQCCFLRAFLPHLEQWNAHRGRIAGIYDEELVACPGVGLVKRTADSVHHLYVIRTERRDDLRKYLAQHGVGSAVHYPVPLHQHPAFAQKVSLPAAERAAKEILSLPMGPYLRENVARRVAQRVRSFYR